MLVMLLYYLLEILKWLIIARALMSWFASPYSNHPVARFIRTATDPILRPLSQVIPPLGGMDISPLIAFFAIHLTQTMLVRL
jgi:YggT family protein